MTELAIILIRGRIGAHYSVKHTLDLLKLTKKHGCAIVKDDKTTRGMTQKIKDYVTWGEIDVETKKLLQEKRGKESTHFQLSSPKGGYEKKGIKTPYTLGGALGYRKEAINALIKKML